MELKLGTGFSYLFQIVAHDRMLNTSVLSHACSCNMIYFAAGLQVLAINITFSKSSNI
jgi:hypothetical protein